MQAIEEYLAMGGYAAFVWPCFAVTLAVMIGLFVSSKQRLARLKSEVAALEALDSPRQASRRSSSEEGR